MILSSKEIKQAIKDNKILTSYNNEDMIKNQSIDVRLGRWVYIQSANNHTINKHWHDLDRESLTLYPGKFYIAHTEEFIGTSVDSNILPSFKLKSSAGRLGIIHTLAGHGDVGFCNRWAMEFMVGVKLTIERYMSIGQIYFTQTTSSESYSKQTGTYQSSDDFTTLQENWNKEIILPPNNLKIII